MWDTAGRLIRVLELLQRRRQWGACDLAQELGVTTRTVRRDIERLRAIGYPVDATAGLGGGYRLTPGASLPPLMFDADEAVATVLALQTASVAGAELVAGSTLRALTKLTSVMPRRLRRHVEALTHHAGHAAHPGVIGQRPAPVDSHVLISAATACRERLQVRASYLARSGEATDRVMEPLRLVRAGARWYLVAWDLTRSGWRTFRVDRFGHLELTRTPTTTRTPPAADVEAYVLEQIGAGLQQRHAVVLVHAPVTAVQHWIDPAWGRCEATTATTCTVRVGADSLAAIARWLVLLDADLTVIEPPALAAEFDAIAARASRAARAPAP